MDRELSSLNGQNKEDRHFAQMQMLDQIIHRYGEEIVGRFKVKTFKFSRKILTGFFKRLLNAASSKKLVRLWGSKYELYDRFNIYGEYERVRHLFDKGVVVLLPTHFSNLDSILIGYALDSVVGLPSFSYGAGLNLFDSELFAYFMNRLGAYRVDRRKRNPIYMETLKSMSNLSISQGTNSLFFPGGTRSRSGAIEDKLKFGLLSSLIEAQREMFEKESDLKIIVVPLVLNYHFVLEARHLINQHLKIKGEERYSGSKDEFKSFRRIFKFLWQFFSKSSEVGLSFGTPMDVMGKSFR